MTVRTSAPIVFTPGKDLIRTDRGVTWGIKVTDAGDVQAVHVFEQAGSTWTPGTTLADLGWPEQLQQHGGDMRAWFKATALPKLNAWLAQRFPPLGQGANSPSEQLDALIVGSLRIATRPDGTLSASID